MNPEEMKELEKNARDLILAITEKTLKTLKDNGLLKEMSRLQKLSFSNPGIRAFLEKFKAPKYDPHRRFRKGDEVSVTEWNGRSIARIGQIGRVVSDESNSRVEISIDGWKDGVFYPACHLKLITPVEELKPYFISEGAGIIEIWNGKKGVVKTWYYDAVKVGVEVLTLAEAECARLNEEYRKECKNG